MSSRTILITAAVTAEIGPLVRKLRLKRDPTLLPGFLMYAGEYVRPDHRAGGEAGEEVPIVVVVTGVGRSRAMQAASVLLERHAPRHVFITGFAGGLDPSLKAGDVVVPQTLIDCETGGRFTTAASHDDATSICTTDRLIDTPTAKAALRRRYGGAAVDMESAAIAAQCVVWKIPWTCVRAISDTAGEKLPPFLLKLTFENGRANPLLAAALAVSQPKQIGPLIRLGRHSSVAAKNMAARLIGLF